MELLFNLHWLRESGHDLDGTPVRADELDPAIRARVLQAAEGAEGELALKLPYLDLREIRRRSEVLGELEFKRCGNEVLPLLTPRFAFRTAAADVAMSHPAWINASPRRESRITSGHGREFRTLCRFICGQASRKNIFGDPQAYVDRGCRIFHDRISGGGEFIGAILPTTSHTICATIPTAGTRWSLRGRRSASPSREPWRKSSSGFMKPVCRRWRADMHRAGLKICCWR